jgi:pyruvate carboxylase
MYPQVFTDFAKFQKDFSDPSVLPTPAFFYGLKLGEEISVPIEEGKLLFIKLINVTAPDKDGRCVVGFELNGMPREVVVVDKSIAPKAKPKVKADSANPLHIGAPIPGMVTALQTTLYAHADGIVDELLVAVGDAVEAGDLLARIRA